jgi:predicted alpha/beta hydrolase family esterase
MARVLILPGVGGSGPEHWQSRWEANEPSFRRAEMPSWSEPELESWLTALDEVVRAVGPRPVVAAHSLGCLALAHYAARGGQLGAALLVAPPDPEGPAFPAQASSFAPVALVRLPFRSRVVASLDDPYAGLGFARRCAEAWGSEFVDVGARGHINAESRLGDWPEGRELLADLLR